MKNLFFILLVLFSVNLSAQDCISWNHYRVVTIDNTAGVELTDYQVRIQLNTSELVTEGKLQATGADIRVFSDDCSPLPFWGDSLGVSVTTDIWVKIPLIPANSTSTIQIYYGDPAALSTANGDDTFIFFDEFSSENIDLNKWETIGEFAQFSIEDSILNYGSTSQNPGPRFKFVRTAVSFSDPVIFDYVGAITNSNGFGFSSADVALDRILFRQAGFGFDTLNQVAFMADTVSNGFQVEGLYPLLRFERFIFNTTSITAGINTSSHLELNRFANESIGEENTDNYEFIEANMTGFHFILSSFSFTPTIKLANIRVRQATINPPSTTLGPELTPLPNSVNTLIDPARIEVFPNPSSTYSLVKIDIDEQVQMTIQDITGRQLPIGNMLLDPGQSHRLDTESLPKGLYFLTFKRQSDGALLHTRKLNVIK
jgi:uncharacterized protein DUF2341/type IX secretion system substrate protein